ncbi:hypothetical protein TRAPUB_1276 [Trametes pubescens]|uniref:HAT C-terminal dimerisation domain-containing protein n=1 Tax=Trametes pubescens TaxID=154538 RepID=A0A1M2VJT0_TRAPU|nr:hypothetical protein TRAPUB_1276 [Trametes pubescens]
MEVFGYIGVAVGNCKGAAGFHGLRPFKIVEDRALLSLLKTGRPGYFVPSPSTVLRDLKVVFARSRNRIAKLLQEYEGDLHFASDEWSTPNHRAFMAITVHFVLDGKPMCLLLDFIEVAWVHSGENLASTFTDVLKEFGIAEKMMGITCDNASNNDTMVEELKDLLPGFPGNDYRVRCFAHVLNLVVKSLIKHFDVRETSDPATAEGDARELLELAREMESEELTTQAERAAGEDEDDELDDADDEVDGMAELTDEQRVEFEHDVLPVKLTMAKLRKLAFKIVHSTTKLLPAWKELLGELGQPVVLIPRDVRTRWNSTFEMLDSCLKHQKALTQLCSDKSNGLRSFEVSEREWEIAKQLCNMLKVFKDATSFFSKQTPNLASVIPAMDHIDAHLTTASLDEQAYDSALRVSAGLAQRTLNKYYSLTDDSTTYRIAMMLHPRHKLLYFKKMKWKEEWISNAREILRTEYEKRYANCLPRAKQTHPGSDESGEEASSLVEEKNDINIFEALEHEDVADDEVSDELTRYLSTDPERVKDALEWWNDRRASFPNLSRMALDYLSIPATSVDPERMFSRGRLALPHTRNRLSPQSTRALMCVGNWSIAGFIRQSDARKAAQLEEVEGGSDDSDFEMEDGWDKIDVSSLQ